MKAFGKVMLVITPFFLVIGLVAAYSRYRVGLDVTAVFPDFDSVLLRFSSMPSPSEYWSTMYKGAAAVLATLPAQFKNVHDVWSFLGAFFTSLTVVPSVFVTVFQLLAYPFVCLAWFLWSVVSLMLGI